MAIYKQEPKQLIDTGEIGNASTGDILFDGGNKINDDINAIYNSFGDQRKMATANGQGEKGQTIHATGYYQKTARGDFSTPIPIGTMHDIDTTEGGILVTLSKGVPGELVVFVNSNGSISSSNPLTILAQDSFVGISGPLIVTVPYSRVECWCIGLVGGSAVWNYSIDSLFGQKQTPIEGTYAAAAATSIPLFHKSEYNFAKLVFTCQTTDAKRIKNAEINILIDSIGSQIISTEYSVMRLGNVDEEDEIAKIDFNIDASGIVQAVVTPTSGSLRVAVKSIATQKIGVPQ